MKNIWALFCGCMMAGAATAAVREVGAFGAKGDGRTLDTAAIQRAIDTVAAEGGGEVVLTPGTYLSGTVYLKSHVTLRLERAACLLGSPDLKDYNAEDAYPQNWGSPNVEHWRAHHLLVALEQEDVAVVGEGIIDGNGRAFFSDRVQGLGKANWRFGAINAKDRKNAVRPGQMLVFVECRGVRVENLRLYDAPCWNCFCHGCEDVRIRDVTVVADIRHHNTDGFDIDCCRHVRVSGCEVETGDDCFTVRADVKRLKKPRACEDVRFENCRGSCSACGVRIGVGDGEIRNVVFSNLVIRTAGSGLCLQSNYSGAKRRGVDISDVRFEDFVVRDASRGIAVTYGTGTPSAQLQDISFVRGRVEATHPLTVAGGGAVMPDGISFSDIALRVKPDRYAEPCAEPVLVEKAGRVTFDRVTLEGKPISRDSAAATAAWHAGFARIDLEPPLGLSLAGYFEDRPCSGVRDPVEATCVALGDGKDVALLYTIDLVEIKGVAADWKKAIAAATGVKPEAVVLACTHTHTAPSVGPAAAAYEISVEGTRAYDAAVLQKLIAVGKAAQADIAPATMRQARTEAKGLSFVRRFRMQDGSARTNPGTLAGVVGPIGTPDESVQIVRLDRGADKPALALVNFQCHADMIGGTLASADWPGFARRALERDLGVRAAIFNGAAGDTNHIDLRDPHNGYEACRAFGEKVAASVRTAWEDAALVAPAALAATYQPVEVALRKPTREELAATNLTRVAKNRVKKLSDAPLRIRIPVTHLRFGDAFALCGYPCEPFTEIGRDTKRRVTAQMTFVMSLTDGSYGYLPTADAYDAGAYETDSSIFAPGADRLMTMAVALAGRLPAGMPKVVRVKGIPNMRDFGGWRGLGGRRVRLGRVYRSAGINDNAQHKVVTNSVGQVATNHIAGASRIDAEGRFAVTNALGIRTDLDLRTAGEVWGMAGSPAGENVVWTNVSSGCYGNLLTDWGLAAFRADFRIFLDERNYPIVFHCIGGADRTGTLAYVLNALLGVAEDDLDADYAYTTVGWSLKSRQNFLGNLYPKLHRLFERYPGRTVNERVEAFVKSQGFTDADIAHFRELMLDP